MFNPMDNFGFNPAPAVNNQPDFQQILQQARQNPQAFENFIRQTNPQAYQQAMQIMNSPNPQAIIKQMAQAKGINPNILAMFGIH